MQTPHRIEAPLSDAPRPVNRLVAGSHPARGANVIKYL